MKRVALFSDGWKRLITYAWVEGMMSFMSECDEDIILCQYNCHGNWSPDEKHNQGEYNIYTLPDLSRFDGVIMDCNNVSDKSQLDKLVEIIRKSGKPAISIGIDVEGFYYAGIDNKKSICELMEHLYKVHNCRKYIYAGGPAENFENELRVEAYLESLDRFGLSREDNPVWYSDYDFSAGIKYFEQYLESFEGREVEFPDVFVCANDNIAAGLCHNAQMCGYHIPGDFKVTGFDNLDKALYYDPQITTVSHMREHIGSNTMETLVDIWAGKDVPRNNFMPSVCIFTESCGCPNSGLVDYRKWAKDQIINSTDRVSHEELLIQLEGNIVKCRSYDEVFVRIGKYFMSLACDGFAIVVDKRLYEAADESAFAVDGYDEENMIVAYAADGSQILDMKDPKELAAYCDSHGAGNTYLFTPLHFRERTVGYSVLKNGHFLYDNPYFYDIHSTITRTLENLYKKLQIENANKKMREIYNRDQLTGLYNRIAYTDMVEPKYRRYCMAGRRCALYFVDADGFKQINDVYGHKKGDMILKEIARVLSGRCPEEGYVYRYGGDEFVAFFPIDDEEQAQEYKNAVLSELKEKEIRVSVGMTVTDPYSDKGFEEYMQLADKEMYRAKAAGRERRI